jgi:hypothetical protein
MEEKLSIGEHWNVSIMNLLKRRSLSIAEGKLMLASGS